MKYLKLTNSDKVGIIDDSIYNLIKNLRWSLSNGTYIICSNRSKNKPFKDINKLDVYLHRLVFDKYKDTTLYVDHINGNELDNRLENLRYATNQQNQWNSKISKNNKSGLKGVSWHKQNKGWHAQLMINHKQYSLGFFKTKEEAYHKYCEVAREKCGEFFRQK